MNKTINIFSARYPYTKFEVYLDSEVLHFASEFDKVFIFPYQNEGDITRKLPENSSVINPSVKPTKWNLIKYFRLVFILFITEIRARGFIHVFKNLRPYLNYLSLNLSYLTFLLQKSKDENIEVAYSNWFVDWSLVLCVYKRFYNPKMKLIVKCHRYDLYEEEYYLGFIPFRKFELSIVDKVVAISDDGYKYLNNLYPDYSNKMQLFRLGSPELGTSLLENKKDDLVIVTCSNIKKVKRLDLMVKVLSRIDRKISWNHFGDGDLRSELEILIKQLPSNITVKIHGRVNSEILYEFYRNNFISVFINLSASEGIPVSIMEAISFGIPIIATDVGGTSEIVNQETGMLLPHDFEIADLSKIISKIETTKLLDPNFRKGVRAFWEKNYESKSNTTKFVKFVNDSISKLSN